MEIDTTTLTLLTSVLSSTTVRKLFTTIANSRIAEKSLLKQANPEPDQALDALKEADLITSRREGQQIWYALNTTVVQDVMSWAMDLLSENGKRGTKKK